MLSPCDFLAAFLGALQAMSQGLWALHTQRSADAIVDYLKSHPDESQGDNINNCLRTLFKNDETSWTADERLRIFAAYAEAWDGAAGIQLLEQTRQHIAASPLAGPTWSQIGPKATYHSRHDWHPALIRAVLRVWPEAIDSHVQHHGEHPLDWLKAQTSPGSIGGLAIYGRELELTYEYAF